MASVFCPSGIGLSTNILVSCIMMSAARSNPSVCRFSRLVTKFSFATLISNKRKMSAGMSQHPVGFPVHLRVKLWHPSSALQA